MNVQALLQELDGYFQRDEHAKIEPFLLDNLALAEAAQDKSTALTLLNELMGFYRGMSRFQDALATGNKALAIFEELGYKDSIPYATTLLNVATAWRADGQTERAIELFEEVGRIFAAQQLNDAYLHASLYNNLSLAYQEAGQHDKAIEHLDKALPLVRTLPDSEVEMAVTYTNRALSKTRCGRLVDARSDLQNALQLFESQPIRNSHYGAALAAMGEVAYKEGQRQEAIQYYERALDEIRPHYGKNMYYAVTLGSLAVVYEGLDDAKSRALAQESEAIRAALI